MRKADGATGVVQAVEVEPHAQVMYNLTVVTAHTFFVGERQWLVHNTCRWLGNDIRQIIMSKYFCINTSMVRLKASVYLMWVDHVLQGGIVQRFLQRKVS